MTAAGSARPELPPLARGDRILLGAATVFGVGVGGVGLALSFDTVSAAGARWGFTTPQMLPLAIDLAIPVFTVINLLLIRMDMALSWVRFVPWALTLVTCWLNIAAGTSASAKVAHGTMPMLWVALSEVAAHVYAARIGAVTGRRMEKIRRSRWVLAPITTFALWRRMTLWEITSYTEALNRERDRQLIRADLRQEHGRRWRSQTDRRTRVLLKLGELAPAAPDPGPPAEPPIRPAEPKPVPRQRRSKPAGKAPTGRRTLDDLMAQARALTADWPDAHLTADRLREGLHCGAAQARSLRDALKTERAAAPATALGAAA
ncbi:DUF2637 domain-containing protein [Actinacidiphila bryophytorum]|uniref:DUF2637 domain-containing protein n=1 Tax=Actinacidiphila bryophytorum TaxID=1436133 RepID=A0A9W4MG58_9ACTN|nr:DUF2637 domain-containing protein [Actinacidiphila bryophytorum]MBM9438728.1 DUF2637 domain-containing protein [Actinacidiphila bryophytorum]MBN6545541.1 DUF2637 domain-containing protein [Actinacidiphila bryophytorum]CAG7637630.1 conserved membrane hypothetical protein [Actinacidiphila bryophytorum]